MPEGPETRIVVDNFRQHVKGKYLINIDYSIESVFDKHLSDFDFDELFPLKCIDVTCRGKYIFIWLDNDICILNHMMLTGRWIKEKGEDSHLKLSFGTIFDKPIPMKVTDSIFWFDDSTGYGIFKITNWEDAKKTLGRLGPDFLETSVPFSKLDPSLEFIKSPQSLEKFKSKISSSKAEVNICKFLTKQRNCTGIGNYLKSEILFKARVKPDTTLESLSDSQLEKIYKATVSLIKESYKKGGLSVWVDYNGNKGGFETTIYGKSMYKKHKLRITNDIDGRKTYWVEKLQK